MKMTKKEVLQAAALLVVVCVVFFIYQAFKPGTVEGAKEIKIVVVHADGEEKEFTYNTDAEYLGEVLEENKLVEGNKSQYGLFITTVDGEKADDAKQQWWCITKAGEQVNTAVDDTPVQDGEQFELTLKEGY